jgi:hypothetical protein
MKTVPKVKTKVSTDGQKETIPRKAYLTESLEEGPRGQNERSAEALQADPS